MEDWLKGQLSPLVNICQTPKYLTNNFVCCYIHLYMYNEHPKDFQIINYKKCSALGKNAGSYAMCGKNSQYKYRNI